MEMSRTGNKTWRPAHRCCLRRVASHTYGAYLWTAPLHATILKSCRLLSTSPSQFSTYHWLWYPFLANKNSVMYRCHTVVSNSAGLSVGLHGTIPHLQVQVKQCLSLGMLTAYTLKHRREYNMQIFRWHGVLFTEYVSNSTFPVVQNGKGRRFQLQPCRYAIPGSLSKPSGNW